MNKGKQSGSKDHLKFYFTYYPRSIGIKEKAKDLLDMVKKAIYDN